MAEVWEATDEVLTRPVAVKILLPHLAADEAFLTRFRREAVAAARLSHPHIVSIFDTWTDGGYEGIVMDLVRGSTLREVLDEDGKLPAARAASIGAQVADALDGAHRQALIHRDIKPGNILLADDGRVLVADFGIAKAAEATSDLTEVGRVMGTAKYLSPEQVEGRPLDARSDVYALGVVLYESLCGRPPFAAEHATATAVARLHADPAPPRSVEPSVPPALEAIVLKAMARRPDDRYPSAAALRSALESVDLRADATASTAAMVPPVGEPTTVHRPDPTAAYRPAPAAPSATPPPRPRPGPARRPARRSSGALALLLLVVAATLALVGALLGRTDLGRDLFHEVSGERAAEDLDVVNVVDYDPVGGDGEHPEEVRFVDDGDAGTAWSTENYGTELRDRKPGVGVALSLPATSEVDEVEVATTTTGWAAEVYVADTVPPDLAGWGPVRARAEGLDGDRTFELDEGSPGAAVLVWLTDVGETGQAELSEVVVRGSPT